MDIIEISGFQTGVDRAGVNFLDPRDAFETIKNGFIYRQVLYSRKGFTQFATRLPSTPLDNTRVMGIFEFFLTDGTRELLVIDKNYLYKYNSVTNAFDKIANGSAGVDVYPFSITSDDDYVSGSSYPDKDGSSRFVFTGKSMTDVYFYDVDSNSVKRYTNTTDNPEYVAPSEGALTRAIQLIWFGERLNFISPTIGGTIRNQSILFSGIRNSSGTGDKYNSVGSGIIAADTYENLLGCALLGDILILNFSRSNWTLEKTRDVFNPYFIRKIPSVIGTDASFSAVSWAYQVKSAGKTGMIATDGRESLRFDDKIPFFTRDEFDQPNFNQTYGGFDRNEGQFLFSYNTGEFDTQNRVLVFNYEEKTWAVYDWSFSVFGQSDVGQALAWNQIDENTKDSWERWDTTEEIWNRIGLSASTQKTLAGDDKGYVYEINEGYNDYFVSITNITQAFPAVISISETNFRVGDQVIIENTDMTEINADEYTEPIFVTAVTSTTISVNVDSTNFTAYTTGGSISKVINFQAQTTVFNPYRDQGRRCYLSHIEVLVNTNTGNLFLDVYENSIIPEEDNGASAFKTIQITPTTSTDLETEWITAIVNDEANFFKFVLRNRTFSDQKIIKALRLHCSPGSLTAG